MAQAKFQLIKETSDTKNCKDFVNILEAQQAIEPFFAFYGNRVKAQ